MDLFFDQEFRSLIPPLTAEEHEGLEASLIKEGNRDSIIIWKETKLLLDGHNRYDICHKHNIPLKPPAEMSFPDRDSAMLWIIYNQLHRRNLPPYARSVLALKLEDILARQAKKRQEEHGFTAPGKPKTLPPTLAGVSSNGETRDKVAELAKVSHGTLKKVKVIEEKASPQEKAKLVKGEATINQVYVNIRREEVKKKVAQAEWPGGKYRVIYADPPWQYSNDLSADKFNDSRLHYPTMPLADICALPVKDLALDNAVLFLWATSPMLEIAFSVLHAWGFGYKTSFVWDKKKCAFGHYNGVRHEFLLVAVRGSCQPDCSLQLDSVQQIERTEHSKKPEEFRKIIDSLYPYGPRIELFGREQHDGWVVWGNQVKETQGVSPR